MKDKVKPGGTFDYRTGIPGPEGVFPGWEGMLPDADPGSHPANKLVLGLNVRPEAGQVKSRLGLKKVADLPLHWENAAFETIQWLGTHHMQFRTPFLWIVGVNPPLAGQWSGLTTIGWYNPDANPDVKVVGQFSTDTFRDGIGRFGPDMFMASGGKLFKLSPKSSGPVQNTNLVTGLLAGSSGNCLQEFGGILYIGNTQIWDGVSAGLTGTATNEFANSCVWRDTALFGIQGQGTTYYGYGSETTWYEDVLPGNVNNYYKNSLVEYRDAIYIASGEDKIFKVVPSLPAGTAHTGPAGSEITAICAMGDNLFYAYSIEYDVGNHYFNNFIGMYDGDNDEWVDEYMELNTAFPPDSEEFALGKITTLAAYRNRLCVGCVSGLATHEKTSDPTSSWYEILNPLGSSFQYITGLKVGG